MTLPALYEIADEYQAAAFQLADLDLDEQTIADTLESLDVTTNLENKAVAVAKFLGNLDVYIDASKAAETAMAARRKAFEKRKEQIKDYLQTNLERCGISKIESPWFKISLQKNPPSVVIDDAGQIPGELYIYPDPPEPSPDKKAIADRLKAGEEVPGAHLEQKQRLVIK